MRLRLIMMKRIALAWLTAPLVFSLVGSTRAQTPSDLMPEASAIKAKSLLHQAVEALGGARFVNVHTSDCSARMASFERSGASGGSIEVRIARQYPDKTRIEYHGSNYITDIFLFEVHGKGVVTNVYTGDAAWSIGRGGVVSDQPPDVISDYKEQMQTDANTIMRSRLDDPSLFFRYAGTDIVDLQVADLIEVGDRNGHTVRIALDQKTHLPLRTSVLKRDPKTRDQLDRTTIFSNYHLVDGIQTPWQVTRLQNGWQALQTFYESCQYNTDLPDALFNRPSSSIRK